MFEEILENEKRMLFVASSRATSRLLVMSNMGNSIVSHDGDILEYKANNFKPYGNNGPEQNKNHILDKKNNTIRYLELLY